jgi:hypothetical protein
VELLSVASGYEGEQTNNPMKSATMAMADEWRFKGHDEPKPSEWLPLAERVKLSVPG